MHVTQVKLILRKAHAAFESIDFDIQSNGIQIFYVWHKYF